ncbi:hypothetical protein CAS74_001373 [Pichia kudriavzevii]|uniref:Protein ECM18 n=1 Tax=Pichia kudriavzevii TaxID=4909 RepID=A0A099P6U7_PICKU|nr:uncharacterized protein C5L36_0A01800 [Pichia kudriavzevii]AWU73573.1 hypothetical protein C5L36_0A01800 [Pichia kudriavzevii]KGK39964.1 hypothetical protein JL09_g897 [Pichia kudriavzevii]ONH71777.1 Protein ECM18 [Pichia kudriavzevii]OUT23066.1 hypothetical protein CAS74_001373 [Pichia kudriavzevii]
MLKLQNRLILSGLTGTRWNSSATGNKKLLCNISLKESFDIWSHELSNYDDGDTIAQDKFLKYVIPYYQPKELVSDKYRNIRAFNLKTSVDFQNDNINIENRGEWYLNEIRVEKGDKDDERKHLVLIHGYGASSGWFYKNFRGIIENSVNSPNITLHGLDMIGFGLSGRPSVEFKYDNKTKAALNIETEGIVWGKYSTCKKCGGHLDGRKSKDLHWCSCSHEEEEMRKGSLIDSTRRANVVIEKNEILEYMKNQVELINEVEDVYVESLETWRKKNQIDKFDLLAHSLGGYLSFAYSLKYPQHVNKIIMVSPGGVERSPFAISNPQYKSIVKDSEKEGQLRIPISNHVDQYGFLGRYGLIGKSFRDLWNMRVSIFSALRWLGPFGPKVLIDRNASKFTRSGSITDMRELGLFLEYIYSCCIRSSFSETSIYRIFDATIVGKYPILDKIRDKGNVLVDKEILWVYGEHDFMYSECGKKAIEEFEKHNYELTERNQQILTVSNAGHNMYLDNSADFNSGVLKFLKY